MPLTFEEFGAACEQSLNPDKNGLNQSIQDTQTKIDASNDQINKQNQDIKDKIDKQNQDIKDKIDKQNQDIQDKINKCNQDIKDQVLKTAQDIKDKFTKEKIVDGIKDVGEIVKTGTDQISNIATGNLTNMLKGFMSGTGLSSNMVLIVCVIGGVVVLKSINSR